MKRFTFAFLYLSLVYAQGFAAPKIVFKETEFNFGRVEKGKRIIHEYVFWNKGDRPLEIKRVKKSCGCTSAKSTKRTIQPGDSAAIKVVFDTKGYAGKVTKFVTVDSNDPQNGRVKLIITGWVEAMYRLNTGLISFGIIRPNDEPAETVMITFKKKNIRVKKVETNNENIKVIPLGQKDTTYTLVVKLKKNLPEGNLAGRIEVTMTNVLDPFISIPVLAKVAGDVEVVPSTLGFGAQRGKTREVELKILTSPKVGDLKIDSVAMTGKYIRASIDSVYGPQSEKRIALSLNVLESAPKGSVSCTLSIFTKNKKYRKINVPVFGYIR